VVPPAPQIAVVRFLKITTATTTLTCRTQLLNNNQIPTNAIRVVNLESKTTQVENVLHVLMVAVELEDQVKVRVDNRDPRVVSRVQVREGNRNPKVVGKNQVRVGNLRLKGNLKMVVQVIHNPLKELVIPVGVRNQVAENVVHVLEEAELVVAKRLEQVDQKEEVLVVRVAT